VSGGHINPAVTLGLFLARKLSLPRALYYAAMQCLGAVCGAGVVRAFGAAAYEAAGGGANARGERVHQGRRVGCGDRRHVRARVRGVLRHRREAERAGLARPAARAAAHRVRRVARAPRDYPDHRHRDQPSQEPRRRHHLRPAARLARTRKLVCARSNTLVRGAAKFKNLTVWDDACLFLSSVAVDLLGWAAHRSWLAAVYHQVIIRAIPFKDGASNCTSLLAPADAFVLLRSCAGQIRIASLHLGGSSTSLLSCACLSRVYECFFISIFVFVYMEIYWNCCTVQRCERPSCNTQMGVTNTAHQLL
jgi:hypothetical protein